MAQTIGGKLLFQIIFYSINLAQAVGAELLFQNKFNLYVKFSPNDRSGAPLSEYYHSINLAQAIGAELLFQNIII